MPDVYQLRKMLEPDLAASLAGRLDENALAQLQANLKFCEHPLSDAEEERKQHTASLNFHQILAGLAQNDLLGFLVGFMSSMLAGLTVYRQLHEPGNYELSRKGRNHQNALISALRGGDAEMPRATMRTHMQTAHALMERQEAEMERRFLSAR